VIRIAAPAIREVTEYAASKGIRTCTENHGYLMQDAQRVEELILAVGHENYGWLVDMGNFACADQDCAYSVGIAAPYAFHVHAKDFLIKSGSEIDPGMGWFRSRSGNYLRGTVAGHGAVPIAQCVYILKKAGYDGYLTLEFEGMEENLTAIEAGYAYLKRIIGS
jgi:sugar phosphate isomerase/epimerase